MKAGAIATERRRISGAAWAFLRDAKDWQAAIGGALTALKSSSPSPRMVRKAAELGELAELCCVDHSPAMTLYLWAFRADSSRRDLLARARRIAGERAELSVLAKILAVEVRGADDPDLLRQLGDALIDDGRPDEAVQPLTRASSLRHADPSIQMSLAIARREETDVRGQIGRLVARARDEADQVRAGALLLAAARLARLLDVEPQIYESYLLEAFRRNPRSEVFRLLEIWFSRMDPQRMIPLYRSAIGRIDSVGGKLRVYQRGGFRLAAATDASGAALQLLSEGLDLAYASGETTIPGHVAWLSLMAKISGEARLESEFLERLDVLFDLDFSRHELLFAARRGLEMAQRGGHPAAEVYERLARLLESGSELPDAGGGAAGRVCGGKLPARSAGEFVGDLELAEDDLESPEDVPIPAAALDALGRADASASARREELMLSGVHRMPRLMARADGVLYDGERSLQVVVRDVSESGLFIATRETLNIGSELELVVSIAAGKELSRCCLGVVPVRREESGYGCRVLESTIGYRDIILALRVALGKDG